MDGRPPLEHMPKDLLLKSSSCRPAAAAAAKTQIRVPFQVPAYFLPDRSSICCLFATGGIFGFDFAYWSRATGWDYMRAVGIKVIYGGLDLGNRKSNRPTDGYRGGGTYVFTYTVW